MTAAQVSAQTGLPRTAAAVGRLRDLAETLPDGRQTNVDEVAAALLNQLHDQITRGLPGQRKSLASTNTLP